MAKRKTEYHEVSKEEARKALEDTISLLCTGILDRQEKRSKKRLMIAYFIAGAMLIVGFMIGYYYGNQASTIISPVP